MRPPPVDSQIPSSPLSALVVEPNEPDMIRLVSALSGAGFTVSATDNYPDARNLLTIHPPLVVVTEIRLGPYNGLQLALRAQSDVRRIAVVVISGFSDAVLQGDADRAGATFALKPLTNEALLAAVYRTAMRRPNAQGVLEPIRPPFERRSRDRRGAASAVEVERRCAERRKDIAPAMMTTTVPSGS